MIFLSRLKSINGIVSHFSLPSPAILFLLYLISIYQGPAILILGIIFLHLFFGFQSNLIREWLLKYRDYKLEMIVTSENQISAYNAYRNNRKKTIPPNRSDLSQDNSDETVNGDEEAILNIF